MKELVEKWRCEVQDLRQRDTGEEHHADLAVTASAIESCAKELEATLSPRPIEEAPREWFDGRKMLVWEEGVCHVASYSDDRWEWYRHDIDGVDYEGRPIKPDRLLPLPSMDGGKSDE